jgi:hypothetical protein
MEDAYIENLKKRTGRTLEEWIKLLKRSGPPSEKARREWLKSAHGMTTNYASWIAERAAGKGGVESYNPDELVEEMFAGPKSTLRPIYDRLLRLGLKLGKDVKACPCKTIVPLYRNHVFAQLKPTTATRIDLGFALGGMPASGRLIDTGGFAKKDRITHRIPITSLADIDDEVLGWLKTAYDRDE